MNEHNEGSALGIAADVLPAGIVRVTHQAIAAQRYLTGSEATEETADGVRPSPEHPVKLAVFDFDGTSITGNSPVMLVRYLRRSLRKTVLARIVAWGIAYKMRLPQNEAWVRGLVFSVFRGKPVAEVNAFLWDFYDRIVNARFRPLAAARMQEHIDQGHAVVCVSATFEPIIAEAMTEHPIMFAIATRMKANADGTYSDVVDGLPVEGPEKLAALTRFADQHFGKGAWELAYAYGDHHSDRTMLAAAAQSFAVTPDRPLNRTASRESYEVLDWEAD